MSRIKQLKNIDSMIQRVNAVAQNRCSLSDQDRIILNNAINRLQLLKRKKGKTNKEIQQVFVEIQSLLEKP